MSRPFRLSPLRFALLRYSAVRLAVVLLLAMSMALAGMAFLAGAGPAWLILLGSLSAGALALALLRVAPVMWRALRGWRPLRQPASLAAMKNHAAWEVAQAPARLIVQSHDVLNGLGYATQQVYRDGATQVMAVRGRLNRLGFILIHGAALLILLGALLDSELGLRYQIFSRDLGASPHNTPLNEIPRQGSIAAQSRAAFSGQVQLRPGQKGDEVRIVVSDGDLSRQLPFPVAVAAVELDAARLRLEQNFLTRIAILDPHRDRPVMATLGDNRPFHYRGLSYRQQSVADGGSELNISIWPLAHTTPVPLRFRSQVGAERELQTRLGTINIRFSDLKPRNMLQLPAQVGSGVEYKNIGPSLRYTVMDEAGGEREFVNFMLPVAQEGRYFYITGARAAAGAGLRYVHLPVDRDGGLEAFFGLYAALHDPQRVESAIEHVIKESGSQGDAGTHEAFRKTLHEQLLLFREGGFQAVERNIGQRVAKQAYQQASQLSYKLVRGMVYTIYKGLVDRQQVDETDLLFFEDALPALGGLAELAMPFYIQLQDMNYVPVVTLEVSRRPGQDVFLIGWWLLVLGLFLRLSIRHRRLWVVFTHEGGRTRVCVVGMVGREQGRFAGEFKGLVSRLQKELGA